MNPNPTFHSFTPRPMQSQVRPSNRVVPYSGASSLVPPTIQYNSPDPPDNTGSIIGSHTSTHSVIDSVTIEHVFATLRNNLSIADTSLPESAAAETSLFTSNTSSTSSPQSNSPFPLPHLTPPTLSSFLPYHIHSILKSSSLPLCPPCPNIPFSLHTSLNNQNDRVLVPLQPFKHPIPEASSPQSPTGPTLEEHTTTSTVVRKKAWKRLAREKGSLCVGSLMFAITVIGHKREGDDLRFSEIKKTKFDLFTGSSDVSLIISTAEVAGE